MTDETISRKLAETYEDDSPVEHACLEWVQADGTFHRITVTHRAFLLGAAEEVREAWKMCVDEIVNGLISAREVKA